MTTGLEYAGPTSSSVAPSLEEVLSQARRNSLTQIAMPNHPETPFRSLRWDEFSELTVEDAFMASGMFASKSEFNRLHGQGAIKVSGRKTSKDELLNLFDLQPPNELTDKWYCVLRAGKYRAGIEISDGVNLADDERSVGGGAEEFSDAGQPEVGNSPGMV